MLWKIAWKNIIYQPLNALLCIILLLFGSAIISLLVIIQHQITEKLEQDLQNIDLVMGAKGSPLQLVLSAVYHLDAPTGNIKLSEAKKIMNDPLIAEAIPLAYGDNHKGFRILGTTPSYIDKYNVDIAQGRIYSKPMEITLGAYVAEKTGLKIGDTFFGTHGEVHEGHIHEAESYTVVGILQNSNTVLDNLMLTNIESVWQVHRSHHAPSDELNREITAVLLRCKTKLAILNTPRIINQETNMQGVIPSLEINRLFGLIGFGTRTLKLIAGGIMTMAAFSIFFALFGRLKTRKHEFALMRSVGYRSLDLFKLSLIEGFLLSVFGYTLGICLSRIGLYFINLRTEHAFNTQFQMHFIKAEAWLLIITVLMGLIAAFLPAWKAMRIDVAKTLSEK